MSANLFVVLLLVAVSVASQLSDGAATFVKVIESENLPSDVQQYLDVKLDVGATEDQQIVELDQPPESLQEIAAELLADEAKPQGLRAKRRVVVCRYVAIRNNRTRRTVVIMRCR